MTFIQNLHPDFLVSADAYADAFSSEFPNWEISEGFGDRFIAESDMAVPGVNADRAVWAVSDADFDAMCEALWVDPLESDWDFYRH